jgi:hypothetical protein
MTKSITKVKTKSQEENVRVKPVGWNAVLEDIQADIAHLKRLIPIVERKIEKGEPWPSNPSNPTAQD